AGCEGVGQMDSFAVAVRQACGLVGLLPQRLLAFGQPLAFRLLESGFGRGTAEGFPAGAAQELVECVGVAVVRRANSCRGHGCTAYEYVRSTNRLQPSSPLL